MRTARLLGLGVLTAAFTMVPSVAKADLYTRSWYLCASATLKSCHSVQLQTHSNGSGTFVKVTLRNLQGQGDPNDTSAWSALHLLRFYGSGFTVAAADVAGGSAAPWLWNFTQATGEPGVLRLNGNSPWAGVGGCTDPSAGGSPTPVLLTCGSDIIFSFSTTTIWNASQIAGMYLRVNIGSSATTTANTQKACQTDLTVYTPGSVPNGCTDIAASATSVTPEPITIALLGSGLLGIGGARMRRKKKDEADVQA
jgi:hypothetical protein